jgi:hypothetical protein
VTPTKPATGIFSLLILKRIRIAINSGAILSLIFVFANCKKNSSQPAIGLVPEYDTLSKADIAFIDAFPDTVVSLDDIILDDGESVLSFLQANDPGTLQNYPSEMSNRRQFSRPKVVDGPGSGLTDPQTQRNLFFARMFAIGNYLVTRKNFVATTGQPNGLAYMSGSKDYDAPHAPPLPGPQTGNPGCQGVKLYGLDCSGLIYQMTTKSSLPAVVPKTLFGVKNITNVSLWTKAFSQTADYDSLTMADEGDETEVPSSEIESGDIIIFPGHHIGISMGGMFYESGGDPDNPGCQQNAAPSRGPKMLPITAVNGINGGQYEIYRVIASGNSNYPSDYSPLSGTYNLIRLRMQPTPGVVQMGLMVDSEFSPQGDPEYWSVQINFVAHSYNYQMTSYDSSNNVTGTSTGTYSIGPYQPDSLFLPVSIYAGYTEDHPNYGWGYLFPPGYIFSIGFDYEKNGRLSKDKTYFTVVQNGHMEFMK